MQLLIVIVILSHFFEIPSWNIAELFSGEKLHDENMEKLQVKEEWGACFQEYLLWGFGFHKIVRCSAQWN